MEEESPSLAGVPPDSLHDEGAEALLSERNYGGGLNKPLATAVRTFPAIKPNEQRWPVRVRTLGVFSLSLKGKTINLDDDASRHALEFLKILITLGGREVDPETLAVTFRPQSDGPDAQHSIDSALAILQSRLGDRCVQRSPDGNISLDADFCWVDVREFEETLSVVRGMVNESTAGEDALIDELSDRLLDLYHGHFLTEERSTSWSVSLRERLRLDFLHHLLDVGRHWESRGLWDRAVRCYQRGLELDDLVEEFYQRLMVCCLETRRVSEGLAVYRRCRKALSIGLGLNPAPETEALHCTLMGLEPGKHTA